MWVPMPREELFSDATTPSTSVSLARGDPFPPPMCRRGGWTMTLHPGAMIAPMNTTVPVRLSRTAQRSGWSTTIWNG